MLLLFFSTKLAKLGFKESCFNVGVMSENGEGVKEDEFLAFDMYKLTCTKNKKGKYIDSIGCANLAFLYIDGRGIKQEIKKGIEILENSCKKAVLENCNILAKIYQTNYLGIKDDNNTTKLLNFA
ncbi:tetratricopeptide repeat protein [Campylobacter blaseri]|uniref:beta-lactamase n=1 Tax=Campylobacter blaseri TaxID=2042961 RepID=A0A2P8QZS0_9BACT|nr:sel1 repeat family protein [Campylobacter blaseri]PSM51745.1 hypothetical protein CQ405_06345 [Campylobacter blaseri]PSM53536.1 hypothetical protein CRN67_06350 [Campylobacter blaseri]